MRILLTLALIFAISACAPQSDDAEKQPALSAPFPEHLIADNPTPPGKPLAERQIAFCHLHLEESASFLHRERWRVAVLSMADGELNHVTNPIPEAVTSTLGCDGQPVDDSPGINGGLAWSPDGRQLLFLLDGSLLAVAEIAANGTTTSAELLLKPPKYTFYDHTRHPVWSPDGQQIAFISSVRVGAGEVGDKVFAPSLFVAKADGSNPRFFVQEERLPGVGGKPAWSHDSRRVSHVLRLPDNGIRIITPETGSFHQLDATSVPAFPPGTGELHGLLPDESIAWLPGDRLRLMMTNGEAEGHDILWAIAHDGRNPIQLFAGALQQLSASPDGRAAAVIAGRANWPKTIYHLALTDPFTMTDILATPPWRRTPGSAVIVRDLAWSPDGRYLAFAANPNGDFDIFAWDSIERRFVTLTNAPDSDEIAPQWRP